jgi:hypothetical protein
MNVEAVAPLPRSESTISTALSAAFSRLGSHFFVVTGELVLFAAAFFIVRFFAHATLTLIENATANYVAGAVTSVLGGAVFLCGMTTIGLRGARGELKIGDSFRSLRAAHRVLPNALVTFCLAQCLITAFVGWTVAVMQTFASSIMDASSTTGAVLGTLGPWMLLGVALVLMVVNVALSQMPYLRMDTEMTVVQAAQASARMMTANIGSYLSMIPVSMLALVLAMLTCGLSLVATVPFGVLLGGCFYVAIRQSEAAVASALPAQ